MERNNQSVWYIAYSAFFIIIAILMVWSLYVSRGGLPTSISLFDLVILILATLRFVRLFVYDKITFFIRDWFQHAEEEYTHEGVTYIRKVERTDGPLRVGYELLTCPWCFSIWVALLVTYAYFIRTELFWVPILIFAISGAASGVQILVNMFGWSAENKKLDAELKHPLVSNRGSQASP